MGTKFYLVTRGTGFIGSALVRRMVKDGHRVRILDNNIRGSVKRLEDIKKDLEFVWADIRDTESVLKAAARINSIVHLAFINGTQFFYDKPELVLDVGVRGMLNVLDACRKNDIGELILASSSEVYQTPPTIPTDENVPLSIPDPFNPRYSYAGGKLISELLSINYGRTGFERVMIFRPHNVYGPDMGLEHVLPQFSLRMKELSHNNPDNTIEFPVKGTGKETRAFVYIDDFIEGLMLVLEKGKHQEIYNIGTMEELTIEQVAVEVGRYFGKKVTIKPGVLMKGGTLRRCPDISKLKRLGYSPRIPYQVGFELTVKWYDENY